jgi:6-pyruvoyl-tetrahydropterin synthase
MNINIQEIVNKKLSEMHKSGIVQKTIEENLEKCILSAIKDAINSYQIKRDIEKKIETQVAELTTDIGFTAYNTFISEKIKQITEAELTKDLADKINDTFNKIFINKRESIKLSEICNFYRDYICEDTDSEDKYDLQHFFASLERSYSTWLTLEFSKEKPKTYEKPQIKVIFSLERNDPKKASILSLYIDGKDVTKTLDFRYINKIEAFFINLYYNKTTVEIDIDEDDIDTSFDYD